MKLHEQINRIHEMMGNIKEDNDNPAIVKLNQLIDKFGLDQAIKFVGGLTKVAKMLGKKPIDVVKEHYEGRVLSSRNEFPHAEGYDFRFKIQEIEKYYDTYNVEIDLLEGTVQLMSTGETHDLFDPEFRSDSDLWWEIKSEIRETLQDYLYWIIPLKNNESIYLEINYDEY
jgi:hypothetical protein